MTEAFARAGADVFAAPAEEEDADAFSRSRDYGFLTSDPAFAGAGVQFEAGLHLPGLLATRELPAAQRALGAAGFELRALDSRAAAESALFWLRFRGGLGRTAEAARARFAARLESLLSAETGALMRWRDLDPGRFDDGVHRAAGLLRSARRIEFSELSAWISFVRAGARLGLADSPSEAALETLRLRAQPFHLAAENPDAPPEEEARLRAALARTLLSA